VYSKGTCPRYKAKKVFGMTRYAAGQKYCSSCGIFIKCDGMFCPCCSRQLRIVLKCAKAKLQYLEDLVN